MNLPEHKFGFVQLMIQYCLWLIEIFPRHAHEREHDDKPKNETEDVDEDKHYVLGLILNGNVAHSNRAKTIE